MSPYTPASILIGKMTARRITSLCKRTVIYIRQVWVKHIELTLWYRETFFNDGSMTTTCHILNVHEGLEGHAQDRKCA